MTETKKTPEQLPVQTQKLVSGINLIFAGIGEILSAMEPEMAKSLQALASIETAKDALGYEELPTGEDETAAESAPEPEKKAKPKKKAADKPTELTADDLIKVVTQKIKQNRSNNEKIGSILKSYGVAKVSDLPAAKYEAFVTDLSAI